MDGLCLVGVKRASETKRPRASLFERGARVCGANSEVQGASSPADEALIFWFFLIKQKEQERFSFKRKEQKIFTLKTIIYKNEY